SVIGMTLAGRWADHHGPARPLWYGLGCFVLGLLLAGALALPSHDWETPMTVTGSLLLAATHIWNARHRHAG
ncbi:MerC family mercury resistance protein, partial [Klebsiella pneumoniae]|uniref:MerC family mercury resistance protein n=1 Tax=Klebsiella pneumoniae TaxID=573 RepID=UPI0037BFF5AF